ncbi:MAG: hypothetical protein KC425_18375 [Anaerolineales bacterium]|nr:hypothetical protein [Anaerolineales bacterium]
MSKLPFFNRKRWPATAVSITILLLTLALYTHAAGQLTTFLPVVFMRPDTTPTPPTGPIYGVNFITSAEKRADAQQYQNGLATGVGWNRWPLYWFNVEQSPGVFCWTPSLPGCYSGADAVDPDAAISADIAHGLQTNAILLGTPGFYATNFSNRRPADAVVGAGGFRLRAINSATPQGLYAAVFSDGSDTPGPGKQLNPDNKWAVYVWTAVSRYKPGGVLAQQQGWPAGAGITHWEMWNEPDLNIFWDASVADYARLLKVGYLAAKLADPNATVLFAGLANNFEPGAGHTDIYNQVMSLYDADPLAAVHAYFHDILATHSYFYAWQSWLHVFRATNTLAARGLQKPIWLNESGVAIWNDYPGPVWDSSSSFRATQSEHADFIIQSAFYAMFAGADGIFHFQLYDGCGNQPAYTDFPPHNGELCDANGHLIGQPGVPCAGDANGLYRNPADAICFSQHPQPESARAGVAALQVLTTHVTDVYPLWRKRPGPVKCVGPGGVMTPGQEWIAFYQPATGKRVVGLWALCGEAETAVITATNPLGTALLVAPDGSTQLIAAQNGAYTIQLPAATNRNRLGGGVPDFYPIGGRPYILVEPDPTN